MNTQISRLGLILMIATSGSACLSQPHSENSPPPAIVPSENDIDRLRGTLLDPPNRFNALKEAATLQQNASPLLPELVKLLGDSTIIYGRPQITGVDFTVGQMGGIVLSQMKSQAIPLLTLVVRSTGAGTVEVTARLNAVRSLERVHEKNIAAPLLIALQDPNEKVRSAAYATLRRIWFVDLEFDTTEFLPLAQSQSAFVREAIVSLLPQTHPITPAEDKQRADALLRALEDKDRSVRETAVGVLVQSERWLKDPRAVKPLVQLLRSPSADIRQQAAFTLASYNDRRTIPELILQLGNKDEAIIGTSAAKLGNLKAIEAVDPMIALLSSKKSLSTREHIAGALARIGDPRSLEPLSLLVQKHESEKFYYALLDLQEALRNANP